MDNFKPNHKVPQSANKPVPGTKPAMPAQQPTTQTPGGQTAWKQPTKKTG